MFEKIYDRLRREVRSALVLFALVAACLAAAAIAAGFLCAAGFIYALNQLGPIYACLIAFGVFFFGTVILVAALAAWSVRRRRIEREEMRRLPHIAPRRPSPPALGLQVVQSVGVGRLLPIMALGALAFALASGSARARAEGPRPWSARCPARPL